MFETKHFLHRTGLAALSILLCLAGSGCGAPSTQPAQMAAEPPLPYVAHMPGIAGVTSYDQRFLGALADGGMKADFEICDWTGHDSGINALHAYDRNQEQAEKYAEALTRKFRADPRIKIFLTGHSGGTGLVIWTLERLPPDVMIESALLLSPAISPAYDLSKALSHVRNKMFVFTSEGDGIVLGAGTRLFGTIDGQHTDAAGRIGFSRPDNGNAELYKKLVQKAYDAAWSRYGNIGDHMGTLVQPFAQHVLAPLLLGVPLPIPVPKIAVTPTAKPAANGS